MKIRKVVMAGPGAYLIGQEELDEVLDVIKSKYLFRYGDLKDESFKHKVLTLEQEFAAKCNVAHALATSSGTSSLLIALYAMGVKPGDEIIVPAYTFVATYTSVIFAGAIPVLAEIDESLTLDPYDIERKITPKTKAILPVHMLGNPCDMEAIMNIADKHGLMVLEDACQAAGASYRNRRIGTLGQMGAFSLNIFKTITCGDGGMLITADNNLFERAFAFHDQGHSPHRAGVEIGNRKILGLNFRMNEVAGAAALAQLRKMDDLVVRLRHIKKKLKSQIADIPGIKFRKINDEQGEIATVLTVLFDNMSDAATISKSLNSNTISNSGWHVYSNMEHVNEFLASNGQPHGKGAYPRTDSILSRAMNISIGVVDKGLGAGFGVNILSDDKQINDVAESFEKAWTKTIYQ